MAGLVSSCGGGANSTDPDAASVAASTKEPRSLRAPEQAEAAPTASMATALIVRARARLADNTPVLMEVRVDDEIVGRFEVQSRVVLDHTVWLASIRPGARIDVAFVNDYNRLEADRNLFVESVSVGGALLLPRDAGVRYDRGTGDAAYDGIDVTPGQAEILWNGALRFTAPTQVSRVDVTAGGSALSGVGPLVELRTEGRLAGRASVLAGQPRVYRFTTGLLAAGARLDVVFVNDELDAQADRNLVVEAVAVDAQSLEPSGATAVYDVGSGTAAFDGLDLAPGGLPMNWNGALRLVIPAVPELPNQPPRIVIAAPVVAQSFLAGDTVEFSGNAIDPEDGPLAADALSWWVELHHDTHAHPFQPPTAGAGGRVTLPVRGETSPNIWYRFHLRATDRNGAISEAVRDIHPQTSQLRLMTEPPGLRLTVDGQPTSTPSKVIGVVGTERELGAADQVHNGRAYRFTGWQDGGTATRLIATPATATPYVARFIDAGPVPTAPPPAVPGEPPTGTDGTPMPTTVALAEPAHLASGLDGVLTLRATASGSAAIAGVEFQIDGSTVAELTQAPFEASADTTAYASGQHVVRVRSRDAAGNRSAWASALVRFGGDRALPRGFAINESWVGGLDQACAFAQADDGRFFVAEQGGSLRVVRGGVLLAEPALRVAVDTSGERGLLGVAVHPEFMRNGFIYVYYTATDGGSHNRISRYTLDGDVASGETVLVRLPNLSSATNHNGGALHFGSDGKLHVGVGDNASPSKAQDLGDPFGKLLRLNDDGSVPSDNPFAATQTGLARAVWASGLRNPFTFGVDAASGRLHINDVGQDVWEEINLGAAGANYGWPGSEGVDNLGDGVTAPLFAYKHSDTVPPGAGPGGFLTGYAIVGGAFYPAGGNFPAAYRGSYFFADFVTGFVARLDTTNGNAAYSFARVGSSPVDLRVGIDGALYVLSRSGIARISAP